MGSKTFFVEGLNFNKFIKNVIKSGVKILQLDKVTYNTFYVTIYAKNEKQFLSLCRANNQKVSENKLPAKQFFLRKIRSNIALFVAVILVGIVALASSFFVFKVEVLGLENVDKTEVIRVLNENGFRAGKVKKSYDLSGINRLLVGKLDGISFASAVIVGNTLVLNVHEKIDNSHLF